MKLGYIPRTKAGDADISRIALLPELDFDPVFLARFDCEAILCDELTLLHHTESIDWKTCWSADLSTPLWRFNLHYHEYLLPLAKRYLDGDGDRYLRKAMAIMESWMCANAKPGDGIGWDPYTISMRLVNWLAFYGELEDVLGEDRAFVEGMNASLASQYSYLARHLEKDLLANHYFENLKALVLGALYFGDEDTLAIAFPLLESQVCEQVLPDGMHFELSPMYHKIILEDVLRVVASLEKNGNDLGELGICVQRMCDCLYSLERNTNRTPCSTIQATMSQSTRMLSSPVRKSASERSPGIVRTFRMPAIILWSAIAEAVLSRWCSMPGTLGLSMRWGMRIAMRFPLKCSSMANRG